jgi:Flp pilus assembly protein protease CpaA
MLTFELLSLVIPAIVLFVATISDFRSREVADWINYSLFLSGIAYQGLVSVLSASPYPLLYGCVASFCAYLFGLLMVYSGQWGGGDAKNLVGLGMWLVQAPIFTSSAIVSLFSEVIPAQFAFFPIFILNIFLIGSVYGLVWIFCEICFYFSHISRIYSSEYARFSLYKYALYLCCLIVISGSMFFHIARGLVFLAVLIPVCVELFLLTKLIENHIHSKHASVAQMTPGEWVLDECWVPKKSPQTLADHITSIQSKVFAEYAKQSLFLSLSEFFFGPSNNIELYFKRICVYDSQLIRAFIYQSCVHQKPVQLRIFPSVFAYMQYVNLQQVVVPPSLNSIETCTAVEQLEQLVLSANIRANTHATCKSNSAKHTIESICRDVLLFRTTKRYLCGPQSLGMWQYELDELQAHKISSIKIKVGIPFIPAFFIAFICTIFIGSALDIVYVVMHYAVLF